MKQTIEIEVPDGKKAVWEDGSLKFIDDEPTMPKTWEEFCKVHPLRPTDTFLAPNSELEYAFAWRTGCSTRMVDADRNCLPTPQAAEAHLALMQLHQLRDYYRQGWVPDWSDNGSANWVIRKFGKDIIGVRSSVVLATFLSFQTKEIAEAFLNNFRDLIKQAGDLI